MQLYQRDVILPALYTINPEFCIPGRIALGPFRGRLPKLAAGKHVVVVRNTASVLHDLCRGNQCTG